MLEVYSVVWGSGVWSIPGGSERERGVGPGLWVFTNSPGLSHTLGLENSWSGCLTPLHSHCCALNESKLQGLIWIGGFDQRATKTQLLHSEGANSLRVPPHTPSSKSDNVGTDSWSLPKTKTFLHGHAQNPLTREGRGQNLLRLYTLYQAFCK